MRVKLTENFFADEFACKCGCGLNNINKSLVSMLQIAREQAGIGFTVTSALRCPVHNRNEGGLPSSSHLKGLAVDIKADSSQTRQKILSALISAGFDRIGIARSFIHVDIDSSKPANVCWLY